MSRMDNLNLVWLILSLTLSTIYHPYIECKYCRNYQPPGYIMIPFTLGVALISQHLISLVLPKLPLFQTMMLQTVLSLNIANYASLLWVHLDKFCLKKLSTHIISEEEILRKWWFSMLGIGMLTLISSVLLSTRTRVTMYFRHGFQVKPWTYFWNKLRARRVNFSETVSIIER